MTAGITRSPGIPVTVGMNVAVVGGGYRGMTAELDSVVARAAETLREAYAMDVTIRFNSDRRSGGAFLVTDPVDGIGANAEIGICASQVTAERNEYFAARYPDMPLSEPGVYIRAHVGRRVGEYADVLVGSIQEALEYVQEHADLTKLEGGAA